MIKRTRLLVLAMLVWLRWLLAIFPGYIHPDEFFQNPEITASYLFPIETMTPWEYQPQHAARSIVMPYLTTGIPFYILRLFTDQCIEHHSLCVCLVFISLVFFCS
ncbi:hypothetical protein BDB01DRAFT_156221 [Pilobolus umbonatus]|nr:hypothetical protein BDB01DRAFT_156221 [Pilobolus umbonatus]